VFRYFVGTFVGIGADTNNSIPTSVATMSLTKTAIKNAKPGAKACKISDGGGLHLLIEPHGSKLWRFAYRFAGKQKTLSIGQYPSVSLEEAREAREKARKRLREGIDPSEAKKTDDRQRKLSAENTFRAIAEEWVTKLKRENRALATLKKIEWLLGFAYPAIGPRPIVEISSADVLDVLRRVEIRGRYETARRLRSTIGCVFRYGIATARAENDPSIALRGALTVPKVKHRAALIEPKAVGGLLRAIDGFEGQRSIRAALKLMALLFPRPGELRGAIWSEFDLETSVWTIPAERTKMRRAHRVPLSPEAVAILRDLQTITGRGQFLFPSVRSVKRTLSENTLNAALRRLGYSKDEATAHGFRATASTLLNESGKWPADVIERQLGHVENDDVRRAYSRSEYWDERVKMMSWWATYLDDLKMVGNVVAFRDVRG